MSDALRKLLVAVPFGCFVAMATHFARFGDDHAFGGEANEALVASATGGSIAIAFVILHVLLTGGSTTVTGTIARARVGAMLPNSVTLFAVAAAIYYGIESLEGNGIEVGLPTLVLALLAALAAWTLRVLCAQFARFVDTLVRELVAFLSARPAALAQSVPQSDPLRAGTILTARRLGRAPPNVRRLF
jgi:hypothetical protein